MIGAGNVAHVLGRTLKKAGHTIVSIWNRDPAKAVLLAGELSAKAVEQPEELPDDADIYILAVSDHAIAELLPMLSISKGILIHNAGTVGIGILSQSAKQYGVLWPMKMLRSSMNELGDCTMVIDGNDEATRRLLFELAGQLVGRVTVADDLKRQKMHLIAAIGSNFTNHMYHLAADYCKETGIDFSLFYPLIASTALQIQTAYPGDVQAGPAFRGDKGTLERHRELLSDNEALLHLYDEITASIRKKFDR
ncbi:putative short-subunit dehydrogenase-like oxidoreductase (DUF2520 family) [Sediminibacterium goheungense]|uniref:Putative short-subunit dehydrogenase-like oxidoreductase (DUF2520 family) n=2 Tax=Sediminibacterium goheungense TaxID=1086393 RepID=A0A4R6IZG8_9BACT|nr:putative short-subunit dehydrogenase-like oxidoreductase (DUF2520 family) [Sediminibacterium goheungense]